MKVLVDGMNPEVGKNRNVLEQPAERGQSQKNNRMCYHVEIMIHRWPES